MDAHEIIRQMDAIRSYKGDISPTKQGEMLLEKNCKSKKELRSIADVTGFYYSSNLTTTKLKEQIIENTIGHCVRSETIRNYRGRCN
jgi:hypothetical protein